MVVALILEPDRNLGRIFRIKVRTGFDGQFHPVIIRRGIVVNHAVFLDFETIEGRTKVLTQSQNSFHGSRLKKENHTQPNRHR